MGNINNFTDLYSLDKTICLELIAQKETQIRFEKWWREDNDNEENLFRKDINIVEAYIVIKSILDKLHEKYIEISLSSSTAREIEFAPYFEAYKNKTELGEFEEEIRASIGKTFADGEKYFKDEYKNLVISYKNNCLQDKNVLLYIEKKAESFTTDTLDYDTLIKHLKSFSGFFTYLSGYNTNRNNYYETKEEKSTAVATRIVHDNLPKFCDNIIRFERERKEYLSIYEWLNNEQIITQIKNAEKNRFEQIQPIEETIFVISYYNMCMTQSQIENYNRIIGSYNLLINLYNQNKRQYDRGFRKLENFTPLFKQIGYDYGRTAFPSLLKDKECELTPKMKSMGGILTVETLLKRMKETGEKYFCPSDDTIVTIPMFISYLKSCNDWRGIYWSKSALNIISTKYFVNWHAIKDSLKDKKACVTYNKNREDPIQLRDAIELSELFEVLDNERTEHVFKGRLLENGSIDLDKSPSQNIIHLLCDEIEKHITAFISNSNTVVSLKEYKQKDANSEEDDLIVSLIKEWFDHAIDAMRIVRYFSVRTNKMKGNMANSEIEHMLYVLLSNHDVDWFGWYDLIRNYLTKKPQDKLKKNKLKLNFGTSSLLGGWSDGEEKIKAAVLLKKQGDIFLCILRNKNIFDTEKKGNPVYVSDSESGRMILRNLKFKTLAGKGFKGKYGIKYSEMGKVSPLKAIKCLQKIIEERYVYKYPLLSSIVKKNYRKKETFDKDINTVLSQCYICKFVPINWKIVEEYEKTGELFLFQISCKDYKKNSIGKKDLQTMYWEDVLSENSLHQLCAGAEIFMRNPIEGSKHVHKIGEKMINRYDINGDFIPTDVYNELFKYYNNRIEYKNLSNKAKSYIDSDLVVRKEVKYEIQRDKRFYERKYMFYCPIKLNYKSRAYKDEKYAFSPVNEFIRNEMKKIPNKKFIGIDRGEKHLVYSCIIDNECNIKECMHHDVINKTNYVHKLEEKADKRMAQRKNWQRQENIRNLKEGYISHVVHRLVDRIIKDEEGNINPQSYIVLEDLNTEMKRGRQKIEKQIYQKLEIALAKKLNFVVDKNVENGELGSVSKALQLTPPLCNYNDIKGKKEFGVMLYTRANYTSITDPATGWRQTIYIKDGNDGDIKKQIMSSFSDFGFDGTDYYFEYIEANVGKVWRIYPSKNGEPLDRFQNKKEKKEDFNVWVPEKVNTILLLDRLFENFDKTKSFKVQIEEGVGLTKIDDKKTSWQSLRYVIGIIQQIRNCGNTPADDNFLCSPVRNEYGIHFDTRNAENNGALSKIVDADANGAYNIARKGLIMDAHIKCNSDVSDLDLFISDKEWDMWLLDRNKWNENLQYFSSKSMKNAATSTKKKVGKKARK